MVAIAQSNPYQILSRKIGYSVGLENLLRNVTELVAIYAASDKREVKLVDWQALVVEKFNRPPPIDKAGKKTPPYEHIANFLSELKLIKIIGNELHVLFGLDSLSILRRYFLSDESKYDAGLRYVLLILLLEADGDVFLNCLKGAFERDEVRRYLAAMIDAKWNALSRKFVNRDLQNKVWELLSINSTRFDSVARSKEKSLSPFAKRTAPLQTAPKREKDTSTIRVVEVPNSYLDKVLPTRKGWARDLGLFDERALTDLGRNLLMRLTNIGLLSDSGAYRFWPYPEDLAPLRIQAEEMGARAVGSWDLYQGVFEAYNGVSFATGTMDEEDEEKLILLMRQIFDLYKSGNAARGSIRHQLPLYVLKPVLAGIYLGEKKPLPDVTQFIEKETRGSKRRFDVVSIRGTEGAIVFRSSH